MIAEYTFNIYVYVEDILDIIVTNFHWSGYWWTRREEKEENNLFKPHPIGIFAHSLEPSGAAEATVIRPRITKTSRISHPTDGQL